MNKLLELHFIQNFAPSNLNRDDTGAPKDAIFGGTRRGRISSQSFKKAIRDYFRDEIESLPDEYIAVRTKRVYRAIVESVCEKGFEQEAAEQIVRLYLGVLGVSIDGDDKSQYLLFLGKNEIASIIELILKNKDVVSISEDSADDSQDKKAKKKKAKAALPNDVKKELLAIVNGGKAVDLALFGRMLADLPEKSRDAACQVSHPISTHTIEKEFDFFTAVDDLKKEGDVAGADMLGTVEFYSSCMYRYLSVDLEQLKKNLLEDMDIFYKGIEAFIRASALAIPSGKQNSFAAFNDPAYYLSSVKEKAAPANMLNAFERPVQKKEYYETSLTRASIERFERFWQRREKMFGKQGTQFCLQVEELDSKIASIEESFESWLANTMAKVKEIMEA